MNHALTETPVAVLLVDDHPIVRTGLRLVIEGVSGLRVVGEAARVDEALDRVAGLAPDVVVMDINLPDASGINATRTIKTRWPAVRVLIVSNYADEEYVLGALDAGADGYLLKLRVGDDLRDGIVRVAAGERVIDPTVMPSLIARATGRAAPTAPLSERELAVLSRLATGATSKEIARQLGLKPKTIENYRSRILDKLGAVNSAAAVRAAVARGLITPAETGSH